MRGQILVPPWMLHSCFQRCRSNLVGKGSCNLSSPSCCSWHRHQQRKTPREPWEDGSNPLNETRICMHLGPVCTYDPKLNLFEVLSTHIITNPNQTNQASPTKSSVIPALQWGPIYWLGICKDQKPLPGKNWSKAGMRWDEQGPKIGLIFGDSIMVLIS